MLQYQFSVTNCEVGNGYSSFNCKYKPYIVKHNLIDDFIKVHFLHYFLQQHVSALVMSHLQVDYFP